MRLLSFCLVLLAAAQTMGASGDTVGLRAEAILRTAQGLFDDLPTIDPEPGVLGKCGATAQVHRRAAYCTSSNTILFDSSSAFDEAVAYEIAHLLGHAVQVRHGVADIAFREIRARPAEERKLRGWVTRQVECIAGFIHARAGAAPFDLAAHYEVEPFTGSHWGRNPLSVGPRVSIGTAERQKWFDTGRAGDLSACAVGEFGAELLLNALKP